MASKEPRTKNQREQAPTMLHAVNMLKDMLTTNYFTYLITHFFSCHLDLKAIWMKDFSSNINIRPIFLIQEKNNKFAHVGAFVGAI